MIMDDNLLKYPVQVEGYDIRSRIAFIGENDREHTPENAEDSDSPPELALSEDSDIPIALTHGNETVSVLEGVLKARDRRAARPRRRKGSVDLAELGWFNEYVNRYKEPRSIAFADPGTLKITCYFDYHDEGSDPRLAGWCEFTASYTCPLSTEWRTWTENADQWMASTVFAEHLSVNLHNLATKNGFPQPASVLEMARDLQIHTKGTFSRKVDPTTGAYQMVCKQEHAEGSTNIYPAFMLGLCVFQGGAGYAVEARIQFRLRDGSPEFRYTLPRKDETVLDAFKDVHSSVRDETGIPVFVGTKD